MPKTITVKNLGYTTMIVKISKGLKWRIAVGIWLIKIAAIIMGVGIKIEDKEHATDT